MTEQETREKIVEVLKKSREEWEIITPSIGILDEPRVDIEIDKLADALIAAGIGDKSDYASMKETAVRYKAEVSKAGARAKEAEHRAEVAEHELERRLAEATKAMYVYERALYYATLNGETADEVKYNDALKRAQKDFAENKGD